MPDPVVVAVKGDVELGQARQAAKRDFDGIADDADRAADEVRRAFSGLEGDVASEFDDLARGIDSAMGQAERSAEDTADDIRLAFRDTAQDLPDRFSDAARDIGQELAGASAGADRAAGEIDDEFRSAAQRIPGHFSGIESEVRGELDGAADAARATADDVASSFNDIGSQIDLSSVGGSITGQLDGLLGSGGPFAVAAGTGAALFADDFAAGLDRGLRANNSRIILGIRTGLGDTALREVGSAAGRAYADGFGEGAADVQFTGAALRAELGSIDDALDLNQSTREAQLLADVFEFDVANSINLTRRLIANELVRDTDAAFDLIVAQFQELPTSAEESLEVLSEFAPVFAKLGIEGPQAARFIADSWKAGVFPNIERSTEALQEFNIRLTEADGLRDVITELGLDFEDAQRKLAGGEGGEVLADIITKLQAIEDPARRNALSLEIFGTALEDVNDTGKALDLIGAIDQFVESGDAAGRAAEQYAEAQGGLEELNRQVEEAGAQTANLLISGRDTTSFGTFQDRIDVLNGALETLGIRAVGSKTELTGLTDALDGEGQVGTFAQGIASLAPALDDATDSADGTATALADVRAELDSLFNFSPDQLMRDIADATDELAESLGAVDASAVGFGGAIDIAADGGAELQENLERLSFTQQDNIRLFNDGQLSAEEFAVANATVEANLRGVLSQSDLTADQVQGLIDKYFATPDEVKTVVTAVDAASLTLAQISRNLDLIPNQKIITVTTRSSGTRQVDFRGFVDQFAEGGLARGFALVGEEGPELIDFNTPTRVYSNEDTGRILSGSPAQQPMSFEQMVSAFTSALRGSDRGRGGLNIDTVIVPEGGDIFDELEVAAQQYEAVGV